MRNYPFRKAGILIVLCLGCGQPVSEYEGRWVEQQRGRWEGAKDEWYNEYVEEFQERGPRHFVFEGNTFRIEHKGKQSQFTFKVKMEDVRRRLNLQYPDGQTIHGYIERQGVNKLHLQLPQKSVVLEEEVTSSGTERIIETTFDPIELVREPDNE